MVQNYDVQFINHFLKQWVNKAISTDFLSLHIPISWDLVIAKTEAGIRPFKWFRLKNDNVDPYLHGRNNKDEGSWEERVCRLEKIMRGTEEIEVWKSNEHPSRRIVLERTERNDMVREVVESIYVASGLERNSDNLTHVLWCLRKKCDLWDVKPVY